MIDAYETTVIFNFVTCQLLDLNFSFYSLPSNDPQLGWALGLPPAKPGPVMMSKLQPMSPI